VGFTKQELVIAPALALARQRQRCASHEDLMSIRHIMALVGACALGVAAGHWHARFGLDALPPRVDLGLTRTSLPRAAEIECAEPDPPGQSDARDLPAPALAFERALQQHETVHRFEALRSAFPRLLRDDPERALQLAERIPEDERDAIVAPALGTWATSDPRRAWEALDQVPMAPDHRATLFTALAEQAPLRALSWLQGEAPKHENAPAPIELYRALLPRLLRDDPSTAAALVADMGADAPLDLVQEIAVDHAKHNPRDAFIWVESFGQRSEFNRIQALRAVSEAVVAANAEGAAALLNQTTDAQIRQPLMGALALHKAQADIRAAWLWLQTYRDDAAYRENARALLGAWSSAKPNEVAAVVLEIDDVELQRGAAEQLSNVWRERDPNALRQWLATLPAGPLRDALAR
jgi:hypothetical protein